MRHHHRFFLVTCMQVGERSKCAQTRWRSWKRRAHGSPGGARQTGQRATAPWWGRWRRGRSWATWTCSLMSLTYVVLHIGSNINVISSSLFFWCFELYNYYIKPFFASYWSIPSARLTLHSTKLCTEFNILRKKYFLVLRLPTLTLMHF